MANLFVEMYSKVLGKQVTLNVIMPQLPKGAKGCKCLYLLHGHSDNFSGWMRRTSIERYAEKYNLAVVMPDAQKSFYVNTVLGENYYDYIAKELPEEIEAMFNISSSNSDRYIGGMSMGGYGALKLALREDGRYAAAISLSPVGDIRTFQKNNEHMRWDSLFGAECVIPDEDDILTLAEKCRNRPRIYFAIGFEDFLYDNNRATVDKFNMLGYDFHYAEEKGDHTWEFWDRHIEKALEWMLGQGLYV